METVDEDEEIIVVVMRSTCELRHYHIGSASLHELLYIDIENVFMCIYSIFRCSSKIVSLENH